MISLYEGLSKAEATALFLMRTEVLGLNAWLASVQVPDILPRCPCGWNAQTVRHVLIHCPLLNRTDLITQTQSESLTEILTQRIALEPPLNGLSNKEFFRSLIQLRPSATKILL